MKRDHPYEELLELDNGHVLTGIAVVLTKGEIAELILLAKSPYTKTQKLGVQLVKYCASMLT